jgi:hypothetical protein
MRTYDRKKALSIMRDSLANIIPAFNAAESVGIPLHAACAMLEKESGGQNIWGNDPGGVFCGFPLVVNEAAFRAFLWEVRMNGRTSNGVGPCQITYKGHFDVMEQGGLQAWVPYDNMVYGFGLLLKEYQKAGSWEKAGTAYNGSLSYGVDLAAKVKQWRERLAPAVI